MTVHRMAVAAALTFAVHSPDAVAQDMRFYAQGFGGLDQSRDLVLEGGPLDDTLEMKSGHIFGGAIGWRAFDAPWLRAELEYTRRSSDADQFTRLADDFGIVTTTGSLEVGAAMLNLVADWNVSSSFVPYAGVGVGWAHVKLDRVSTLLFNLDGSDDRAALQGIVGAAIPLSEQFSIFADARLLAGIGKAKFELTPGPSIASSRIKNWSILAGVRFNFGD
jgi:opacity protein-like surface antigen